MNKNRLSLLFSLFFTIGASFAFAEIEYTTGNHFYRNDAEFGYVLKIGYSGPCSGTVAQGKTWTEESNILIGCCPNNIEPTYINIYGTANTTKNVYVGGDYRAGHCLVDGGTWDCGGFFRLGVRMTSSLTLKNGGNLTANDGFQISFGSTASVKDSSTLTLVTNANGEFGANGGILSYFGEHFINLDSASNLVVDASKYTNTSDEFVLKNLITVRTENSAVLSGLSLTVGGEKFNAGDQTALNKHLSGITVEGFEDYAKRFVVNESTQTVDLYLSKIPEPSAFGLIAGTGILALVAIRRRRK